MSKSLTTSTCSTQPHQQTRDNVIDPAFFINEINVLISWILVEMLGFLKYQHLNTKHSSITGI